MAIWSWGRKEPLWSFVIDTNQYAGNFERKLCTYVVGDCGDNTNAKYLKLFEKDFKIPFADSPFDDLRSCR